MQTTNENSAADRALNYLKSIEAGRVVEMTQRGVRPPKVQLLVWIAVTALVILTAFKEGYLLIGAGVTLLMVVGILDLVHRYSKDKKELVLKNLILDKALSRIKHVLKKLKEGEINTREVMEEIENLRNNKIPVTYKGNRYEKMIFKEEGREYLLDKLKKILSTNS